VKKKSIVAKYKGVKTGSNLAEGYDSKRAVLTMMMVMMTIMIIIIIIIITHEGQRLGYRLDCRGIRVRFPGGTRDFSLFHSVQTGSGAQEPPIQLEPETLF
jgi:hypothetical protein